VGRGEGVIDEFAFSCFVFIFVHCGWRRRRRGEKQLRLMLLKEQNIDKNAEH